MLSLFDNRVDEYSPPDVPQVVVIHHGVGELFEVFFRPPAPPDGVFVLWVRSQHFFDFGPEVRGHHADDESLVEHESVWFCAHALNSTGYYP